MQKHDYNTQKNIHSVSIYYKFHISLFEISINHLTGWLYDMFMHEYILFTWFHIINYISIV